uniref:Uncharacterized protein n=1 Tax=Pararge aegeria TaxID=116150 RepID=S4NV92_9NEOP
MTFESSCQFFLRSEIYYFDVVVWYENLLDIDCKYEKGILTYITEFILSKVSAGYLLSLKIPFSNSQFI